MNTTLPKILLRTRYDVQDSDCWKMMIRKTNADTFEICVDDAVVTFPTCVVAEVVDAYCQEIRRRMHNDTIIVETNTGFCVRETRGKDIARDVAPFLIPFQHAVKIVKSLTVHSAYVE